MNFPGEFYNSNNYIDCISFTPPPKIILSNSEPIFLNSMLFPLNGLFYIWTYISVFIYMFPSKPCTFQCHVRDFVDFIANDCKFPVCPFSCQLALSTIFFLSLIYYFLFQGFKIELYSQVSTYTSTSISI